MLIYKILVFLHALVVVTYPVPAFLGNVSGNVSIEMSLRRISAPHIFCLSCTVMPTPSLARAAFFALGAAIGGGAVAALNASKKKEVATAGSTEVTSLKVPRNLPVVEVGVAGDPRFSAGAVTAVGPVLKYGNPGMHVTAPDLHAHTHSYHRGFVVAQAPFPTNLCARRMWRRMTVACGILLGSVYMCRIISLPSLLLTKEGRRRQNI